MIRMLNQPRLQTEGGEGQASCLADSSKCGTVIATLLDVDKCPREVVMPSRLRFLLCALLFGSIQHLSAQQRRSLVRTGTVEIVAAIVGDQLQVRPIPLLTGEIWQQADTSRTALRTGLDGHATLSVRSGDYHLRTAQTPRIDGKRYTWSVDLHVAPDKVTRI
jgi:hypothetical protein